MSVKLILNYPNFFSLRITFIYQIFHLMGIINDRSLVSYEVCLQPINGSKNIKRLATPFRPY